MNNFMWEAWPFKNKNSCWCKECSLQNIIRPVGRIKMHNLVELWVLPALFLSKIFDQVGGNESSLDGLFNFEDLELGLKFLPTPSSPSWSLILKLSQWKFWLLPLAIAGFVSWRMSGYAVPHRYKRSTISVFNIYTGFQARSKVQEILEEGGGAGPSLLPRRDHE